MNSSTLTQTAVSRPAINHWLVTAAVVVPTFMEILDTSIANVALRYIAGGLSASVNDSDWVITSYLAANATILPITGWLSAYLGRRNYFLISIAVFTIASGLCGMATSLEQLILFRVIQGLAGGGLQPSSQGVLIDTFPPDKQNVAMTVFAIAGLIAPVVGPTLGGYITVFYDWRWIFYINIPVGILALLACHAVLEDPDYLKQQRAAMLSKPLRFDYIGLGVLALVVSCWEVLLSKGQEWDWYNDPFWRVQTMAIIFVVGLFVLYIYEMSIENPVVNFRPLRDRTFTSSSIIIFLAFAVLYGCSITLPNLLQTLYGYDAYVSGLVMSPSGVASVVMLMVAGTLLGKGVDARWLILVGLLVMAGSLYWMTQMNLEIGPWQVVWPRVVTFVGISLLFAPLNVAAFANIPKEIRGGAVGLYALLRNEGGSLGTSLSRIFEQRREQFHLARVGEFLDPLNPAVKDFSDQGRAFFLQQTGDPAASAQMSSQLLADIRQQQASSLAFFDDFWLYGAISLALVPLVLLMRRSVAEKGAHISAE
jgi:MFS transporter, DHA2 family, multidrug resistance protein